MNATGSIKQATISAVVIRANGQREDRGIIAYWHMNLPRRLWHLVRYGTWPHQATFVVDNGLGITTARLRGTGTEPLNIAWGTGAGTAAAIDTSLFTEVLVNMSAGTTDHTVGTSSQQTTSTTNDTYRVTGTRTATASGTITNAGLWDAASGGTLYLKGDFTGIALANGDAIAFTFNAQYNQ